MLAQITQYMSLYAKHIGNMIIDIRNKFIYTSNEPPNLTQYRETAGAFLLLEWVQDVES